MKCPNCGKEIANDSVFCEFCGIRIAAKAQMLENELIPKKSSKILWIILGLLVIIVGGGLFCFFKETNLTIKRTKCVTLNNVTDSINYAVGLLNGLQIKMYYLANDSSDEAVSEFIDALENAYMGKEEKLSEIAEAGRQFAGSVKGFEKNGLAENPAWTVNEKMYFQGMVNALFDDVTMMSADDAQAFCMSAYQNQTEGQAGEAITAKCPKSAKTLEMTSYNDSLNYAFGYLNGGQIKIYLLADDTTGNAMDEFIDNVNKGLKTDVRNPQIVAMGKNVGKAIREQEPVGLLGISGIETNFDLIKQGFINGLYNFTKQMDMQGAGQYVEATISRLKFGETKA